MTRATIENAPALDLDKVLYHDRGTKPLPRTIRERRIVWNLLLHLGVAGWYVSKVFDGEEFTRVNSSKAAMEIIFNLDDATVYFSKPHSGTYGVKLVLGNDLDIISDWYFTDGDPDGFSAAMDKFDAEVYA